MGIKYKYVKTNHPDWFSRKHIVATVLKMIEYGQSGVNQEKNMFSKKNAQTHGGFISKHMFQEIINNMICFHPLVGI